MPSLVVLLSQVHSKSKDRDFVLSRTVVDLEMKIRLVFIWMTIEL